MGGKTKSIPTRLIAPHKFSIIFNYLFIQSDQRYFTREHEWVDINIEGNVGTIGITDHAQVCFHYFI